MKLIDGLARGILGVMIFIWGLTLLVLSMKALIWALAVHF